MCECGSGWNFSRRFPRVTRLDTAANEKINGDKCRRLAAKWGGLDIRASVRETEGMSID